jgi:hypothetical protein
MTVEISLNRDVAPRRRCCANSVSRDAYLGAVVDSRQDKTSAPEVIASTSDTAPAQRSIVRSVKRTSVHPGSTNVDTRPRGIAFGPQKTVARHGVSTRNLCSRPYRLVTWDTKWVPEEDHRMLRNKSHSRHVSASSLALDHRYTAVSIGDRLIDKAFVYCKNLRCKG